MIIEVDGRQHLMSDYKNLDAVRDKELLEWGIEVIRIPNKDINENFNGICNYLLKRLGFVYSDLKRKYILRMTTSSVTPLFASDKDLIYQRGEKMACRQDV